MRILVVGGGKSGSWKIRGEQLGTAIGAHVRSYNVIQNLLGYDFVIAVKRIPNDFLNMIHKSGKPLIWDVVDAWPQPSMNTANEHESVEWIRSELNRIRPNGVVYSTSKMMSDARYDASSIVLPHHAWPKYLVCRPSIRKDVKNVGYEGGPQYLGRWKYLIDKSCVKRGWSFVLNGDLSKCDIGLALRDCSGYPLKWWKSNCKLANLQALGLPSICSREHGMLSFSSGAEVFIDSPAELEDSFDFLTSYETRLNISNTMYSSAVYLKDVADKYKLWLSHLNF